MTQLKMAVDVPQAGIEEAIIEYLNNHGIETEGKHVEIEIIAGRKGAGTRATVSISAQKEVVDTSAIKDAEENEESITTQDDDDEEGDAAVDAVMSPAGTSNSPFDEDDSVTEPT